MGARFKPSTAGTQLYIAGTNICALIEEPEKEWIKIENKYRRTDSQPPSIFAELFGHE
jgi:hypothetical protein